MRKRLAPSVKSSARTRTRKPVRALAVKHKAKRHATRFRIAAVKSNHRIEG
jgi:hypothetical protein